MGILGDLNPLGITPIADGAGKGKYFYRILGGAKSQLDFQAVDKLIHEGYVTNPHVYSVVNTILRPTLSIPWNVYKVKDTKALEQYTRRKSAFDSEAPTAMVELLALREKAIDIYDGTNTQTRLVARPNSKQSFEQLFQAWLCNMLLPGNSYLYFPKKQYESANQTVIPLPGQRMQIITEGWEGNVVEYRLYLNSKKEEYISFEPDEIMHSKLINPMMEEGFLQPYGLSPMAPLGRVTQASNKGFVAQDKLFDNGHPLGILSNGSNEPMLPMHRQEVTGKSENQDDELSDFVGAENTGKIKLTTANLKWINMGLNSVDLQILDAQGAALADVCNAYGAPLEIMSSAKGSNFNNKKEAEKKLWNDAILPYFDLFRQDINYKLFKRDRNLFIDYDHHQIPALQQDREKLWKITQGMIQNMILTPELAAKIMGVDLGVVDPNQKRLVMATNLRYADEALPGQTGKK